MKILLFCVFCLSIPSLWASPCRNDARTVLSLSLQNQQHFVANDFLSKLFGELIDIVTVYQIKIKNDEVGDMILQFDDDAHKPFQYEFI